MRMARLTRLARTAPKRKPRKSTDLSVALKSLVRSREGNACAACGIGIIGRPRSVQHRVARGMGGTADPAANSLPNLVLLCGSATTPGSCHEACERRDPDFHGRGFWLWSWENPVLVPVMLASPHGPGITVWLTDSGEYCTVDPNEAEAA
jgi:hypothetical protein